MPPDPKADPEEDANAAACPRMIGSCEACCRITSCIMRRKVGFSVTEVGVGGMAIVVPISREGVGGLVERRVRIWEAKGDRLGKTYCRVEESAVD